MRAFVLLALASGCIISEPEGASQYWPPGLGGTVQAVVAGDLDVDGQTDIVVMQSGDDNQAGLYLIKGGRDLRIGESQPIKTFSQFVPVAWTPPFAAYFDEAAAPRIYAAHTEEDIEVTVLSNTLEDLGSRASTLPGGSRLWTRPLAFPGGMIHYAVGNGTAIDHVYSDFSDVRPILGMWDDAQLATTYTVGPDTFVVVATATETLRASLPMTMGGAGFDFVDVRGDGHMWLGQTAFDLDGNDGGREEIIGFDPIAHDVCVIDPGDATPTPSCVHLLSTFPGMDVTLLVGKNVTQLPGLDIVVAQATGSETSYSVVEDYTYDGATGAFDGMRRTIPGGGPARGRSVLANKGTGEPWVVLTIGTDAAVYCAVGPC